MFFDAALFFDRATGVADCDLGDDGDLLIDDTPITPILLSVGLDRRAEPDDELPTGRTQFLAPSSFSERRGAPTDAPDANGSLTGARLWLLDRAKWTETTRLLVAVWLAECPALAEAATGLPAEIDVAWLPGQGGSGSPHGRLGYRILVDDVAVSATLPCGEGAV